MVAGTATLAESIREVPDSTLHVLPAGDLPPNPLELMISKRFKETLDELSKEYDLVLLDSPPVELVSEALVLAPLATSTIFVVKAMATPAPLVRKSLSRLQRAGANMLGVVLNRLDFGRARMYYGEYGASSYSYGGYGVYGQVGKDAQKNAAAEVVEEVAAANEAVKSAKPSVKGTLMTTKGTASNTTAKITEIRPPTAGGTGKRVA
jgi:polysaccharide biosynthesis transport protein